MIFCVNWSVRFYFRYRIYDYCMKWEPSDKIEIWEIIFCEIFNETI